MKYKLLKDFPFCNYSDSKIILITVKPNAIFTKTKYGHYSYKVDRDTENNVVLMGYVVETNKEWFAKFLGISEDKVDIYEGDSVYVCNYQTKQVTVCEQITEVMFDTYKNVKMFVSKEQAERYYSKQYPKSIDDLDVSVGYYGVHSTYATLMQRQSSIAFAKLTKLHKAMIDIYNKENILNCNWQADWLDDTRKYTVTREFNKLEVYGYNSFYKPLAFPTEEMAKFSLEHHNDLWKQYYEL